MMEYNKPVAQMAPGDTVEGFYILRTALPKTTVSGKPFLSAALQDKSGTIDAKMWDYHGPYGPADEGKAVKIRGSVSEYRGALQLVIDRIRLAEPADVFDRAALVPAAPIDLKQAYCDVRKLVDSLSDGDYAAVCRRMLERHEADFTAIPAAKSVHHSFLGGLLMHTVQMLRLADHLSELYAGTVDRSLLLAGTLLHDLAKSREFVISELGMVTGYSMPGQLLGHLVMGAQEVAELAKELALPEEKSVLLQHMILSHHGEPEFGAAVRPMCAESELLSLIDMVDSRMEIYREAMEQTDPGTFSDRIFALDKRVYHHN